MEENQRPVTAAYVRGSHVKRKSKCPVSAGCFKLSTSTSAESFHSVMKSQARIGIFVAFAFLLVIAIIVIIVVLVRPAGNATNNFQPCQAAEGANGIEIYSSMHPRCSGPLLAVNTPSQCDNTQKNSWQLMENDSLAWNEALKFVPVNQSDVTAALVISPNFLVSRNSCSLQISFTFVFNSSFQVFAFSSNNSFRRISVTSNGICHYGVIDDQQFLTNSLSLRIIITSSSTIGINNVSGSVTSHACIRFENVATSAVNLDPEFASVRAGARGVCSSEIITGARVNCGWWKIRDVGNAIFTREVGNRCVANGISHGTMDTSAAFLTLMSSSSSDTRGYLISPIIETGGATHLLFSLWYIAQCNETSIRVYLVPSSRDVTAVTSTLSPVLELYGPETSYKWEFNVTEIPIPANYDSLQVVLEGIVSNRGNCVGHICYTSSMTNVQNPLLAIDDIGLEVRYDQCEVSNNNELAMLNCSFEDASGQSTLCRWMSSKGNNVPDSFPDFHDWRVKADDQGAGNNLELYSLIMPNGAFFRSPLLKANSNCSCFMSFRYLIPVSHLLNFRLQVNIVLGENTTSDNRVLVPQWSINILQNTNWTDVETLLNLQSLVPFQVEVRVKEFVDTTHQVRIDDLLFYQCDIRLHNSS